MLFRSAIRAHVVSKQAKDRQVALESYAHELERVVEKLERELRERPESERPETQRPDTERPETQRPDAERPEACE